LHGLLGIGELSAWISYPLSFFIYLLVINALNLVDGVDGLASGLGILICAFFGIYFQMINEIPLSLMGYAMIGALLIFFIYNVFGNSSKIFMGDSGSLVLGYIIYLFVVRFCEINVYKTEGMNPEYIMRSAPVVAICVLAIPLIDTLRVMISRMKKGRSPFTADKNHVHHLLLSIGLKHKEVTFVLLFVNLVFIGLGLLLRNFNIGFGILIAVAFAASLTVLLWRIVGKHRTAANNQETIS
jgi:UDP-N-acetylmuramyl pentapeptide phosphotransferase/UDP-N-acetylglucosamine-1-phosphate transferase